MEIGNLGKISRAMKKKGWHAIESFIIVAVASAFL